MPQSLPVRASSAKPRTISLILTLQTTPICGRETLLNTCGKSLLMMSLPLSCLAQEIRVLIPWAMMVEV